MSLRLESWSLVLSPHCAQAVGLSFEGLGFGAALQCPKPNP